jgi:DNA-binding response OmpR family regulator
VRYLERGSDDVLAKPYSYPELRARVRALLRRSQRGGGGRIVRLGRLEIDLAAREVWIDGERVVLTAKEYELLRCLASEPTRVFTREELLRDVWGYPCASRSRTVDSHAARLRQKLDRPGEQRLIVNLWGVGYRLSDPPGVGAAAK